MSSLIIETELNVSIGVAGAVELPVCIDVLDFLNRRDLAEHVEAEDAVDYHGAEDILNVIPFDNIAKFCMQHDEVLSRVIKALEDKYGIE